MRTISHKGKIISMANGDHEQMLRRFDPNNFKTLYHEDKAIAPIRKINRVSCPLCEKYNKYNHYCKGCTLKKFRFNTSIERGCMVLFRRDIIGPYTQVHLLMMGNAITYVKAFKDESEKQLNLIMDFLNQAK